MRLQIMWHGTKEGVYYYFTVNNSLLFSFSLNDDLNILSFIVKQNIEFIQCSN
jgi:hypothetical protein